jgi:hypothetical protein
MIPLSTYMRDTLSLKLARQDHRGVSSRRGDVGVSEKCMTEVHYERNKLVDIVLCIGVHVIHWHMGQSSQNLRSDQHHTGLSFTEVFRSTLARPLGNGPFQSSPLLGISPTAGESSMRRPISTMDDTGGEHPASGASTGTEIPLPILLPDTISTRPS